MIVNLHSIIKEKFDITLVTPKYRPTIGVFRIGLGSTDSIYVTKEELENLIYEAHSALVEFDMEEVDADDPVLSDADALS